MPTAGTDKNIGDETLLFVKNLEHSGIQSLSDAVIKDFDFCADVSLPKAASVALFHIRRSKRGIEMVDGDKTFLNVDSGSERLRRTDNDPDFPGIGFFV